MYDRAQYILGDPRVIPVPIDMVSGPIGFPCNGQTVRHIRLVYTVLAQGVDGVGAFDFVHAPSAHCASQEAQQRPCDYKWLRTGVRKQDIAQIEKC